MRARESLLLLLCAAILGAGCANDFEKQSHISKLRVLAVQADPAELIIDTTQPPPKTLLTALAVDPSGAVIELRWAVCTVLDAVPDPAIDCPGAQGIDFAGSTSATLDLGSDQFRPVYQRLTQGPDGQPPEQLREALASGVPVILGFTATAAAERLDGITTVTLRTADAARPINHNPGIATLFADDISIAADGSTAVPAGRTVRLAPIPTEGSHELAQDGSPEKLNYSFYATGGEIQSLRSADTTASGEAVDPSIDWLAPAQAGAVQLWVVVRDGRGGVGWISRTVQVR
jgi:hypothetical protein